MADVEVSLAASLRTGIDAGEMTCRWTSRTCTTEAAESPLGSADPLRRRTSLHDHCTGTEGCSKE
jgi:hypothetical protein